MHRVLVPLAIALLVLSCGRKGPPLPPIIEVPETTLDLWVSQEEKQVVLGWKYPALTRSGRPLYDLARVEVWRLEVPTGQEQIMAGPAGEELRRQLLLSRGVLVAKLEGEGLHEATRGPSLEWREPVTLGAEGTPPPLFWYAVRSVRRDGTSSALSNIVTWQAQPVPPRVTGLKLRVQKDGITCQWDAVPGASFLLERREATASWAGARHRLGDETSVLDTTAPQGKTWRYRVRAVVNAGGGIAGKVAGPLGDEVEVAYPDIYSPPPPANLVCLPEPEMVRLRWDPSPESGVTYKVFRRQGEGRWEHLEESTADTEFVDRKPLNGETEYAVKAVDTARNQSEALYCTVRVTL